MAPLAPASSTPLQYILTDTKINSTTIIVNQCVSQYIKYKSLKAHHSLADFVAVKARQAGTLSANVYFRGQSIKTTLGLGRNANRLGALLASQLQEPGLRCVHRQLEGPIARQTEALDASQRHIPTPKITTECNTIYWASCLEKLN